MKINWTILTIIGLSGYIIISDVVKDNQGEAMIEYWEQKGFQTDSVSLNIDYTKIKVPEFKYNVPPIQVRNYYRKDSTIIYNTHLDLNDSLLNVIDSLEGSITSIHLDYIKLYPTANKLINGYFDNDSITFDFLKVDGNISTEVYPINYTRYRYQYTSNGFRADPIKNKAQRPFRTGSVSILGGYSFIPATPFMGVDAGTNLSKKLGIGFRTSFTIEETPQLRLGVNLNYKLLQWPKRD